MYSEEKQDNILVAAKLKVKTVFGKKELGGGDGMERGVQVISRRTRKERKKEKSSR